MKKSTKILLIVGGIIVVALGFGAYWYWGIYLPANPQKKSPVLPGGTIASLTIQPTAPSPTVIKTVAQTQAASV